MTTDRKAIFRAYVHTPAELATAHRQHYEHIKKYPGITFGVKAIDDKVIPARPGDVVAFCGRPGAGKTAMLCRHAKKVDIDISAAGMKGKEAVFYVTWEQSAESITNYLFADGEYTATDYAWGRVPMEKVIKRSTSGIVHHNIFVIGHGLRSAGIKLPKLTSELVFEALENVRDDFGVRPVMVMMDYVQLIPLSRPTMGRTDQVNDAMVEVKNLALRIGCPIFVGVQASREVDKRNAKIPLMADAQHSSVIEQTVDKFFGLWRPWKTEPSEAQINIPGLGIVNNSPNLLILKMDKQRDDEGSHIWMLRFSPAEMALAEMELNKQELNF